LDILLFLPVPEIFDAHEKACYAEAEKPQTTKPCWKRLAPWWSTKSTRIIWAAAECSPEAEDRHREGKDDFNPFSHPLSMTSSLE
jgi:hypothetical protein